MKPETSNSKDKMEPAATADRKHVEKIISLLKKQYPDAKTALNYRTPFQLLVATILSAQCTDRKVNEITEDLFRKHKTPEEFATMKREELEEQIRQTGFFRNKAKNIIEASKKICSMHNGRVPEHMEHLLELPGVARKTANIVLSTAFNKAEGIAVDTHVKRLSQRLGLSMQQSPEKIEKDLMKIVPRRYWLEFNCLLVEHGRRVCKARKPDCLACVLKKLCNNAREL